MNFVERDEHRLICQNEPFEFVGWNTYYMMVYAAQRWGQHALDEIFDFAQSLEMTVLRTWAFNDGADQWNHLQSAPGVFDERMGIALDWVLANANRRGIRVILTLLNYWEDYGGLDQYVRWSPTAQCRDDFYTDTSCWQYFVQFCTWLLNRTNSLTGMPYREDPTILAWELGNELRCPTDLSGQTLVSWMTRASALIKSLAPNHLVASGLEGFFGLSQSASNPPRWRRGEGADFLACHAIEHIDLVSAHVYPDHWQMDRGQTLAWMEDHIYASLHQLKKPLYFGEFGQRGHQRTEKMHQWVSMMQRAMASKALAGHCVWTLYHDDYPDYDGFGLYPKHKREAQIIFGQSIDR